MKLPKIGDIVLVHDEQRKDIWPAIIKKINDDNSINVTCFSDGISNMYGLRNYCPPIERICWSWPEEEKQDDNCEPFYNPKYIHAEPVHPKGGIYSEFTIEHFLATIIREAKHIRQNNEYKLSSESIIHKARLLWDKLQEEKPKECEHDYVVKREEFGKTAHYFILNCKKCGKENEMLPDKIEELIEKIFQNAEEASVDNVNGMDIDWFIYKTIKLIKEYKGKAL